MPTRYEQIRYYINYIILTLYLLLTASVVLVLWVLAALAPFLVASAICLAVSAVLIAVPIIIYREGRIS